MKKSSSINKDSIEMELPRGHALSVYCVSGVPDSVVTLTVYRGHGEYFVRFWSGTLTKIHFNSRGIPVCLFEPATSDFPVCGGRRRCQRMCDLVLYGMRCGLDRDDYKVEGIIESIDGLTIVSSDFEDANWSVGLEESGIVYGDITSLEGCTYNASSLWSASLPASKAFDNDFNSAWIGDEGPQWISCYWTSGKIINCVKINTAHVGWAARYVKIEASNNGVNWAKLSINQWLGDKCRQYNTDEAEILFPMYSSEFAELRLNNSSAYTYYRVYTTGPWSYTRWFTGKIYPVCIAEIEMTYTEAEAGDYPELISGLGAGGSIVVGDEERTVTFHQADTITINRRFRNAAVDDPFVAYAGGDHRPNTCRFKFGNIENYGGREFLSVKNPYVKNIFY